MYFYGGFYDEWLQYVVFELLYENYDVDYDECWYWIEEYQCDEDGDGFGCDCVDEWDE